MPMMSDVVLGALGVLATLLAVINTVQVFLGRQLVRPSASRRRAPQLRAESAAAAVTMCGVAMGSFGILAGGLWPLPGAVLTVCGWFALTRARRRFGVPPRS
ncbi:hypothetical protein ACFYZ8_32340 [Streptomyces sp. NPDC001668]|uniref:hypothetical protein n=1 Tax=unclassified Streptomyces TaxID=2593676 RepID=UPI003697807B